MSEPKINVYVYMDKMKDDWFARHLNNLHGDNASNIDSYSTWFVDGVNSAFSCDDSDSSSSHVESAHDSYVGNDFKVFTNPLYD